MADVFSVEAQYLRPGMSARVSLPQQSREFRSHGERRSAAVRCDHTHLEGAPGDGIILTMCFARRCLWMLSSLLPLPPAITVPTDAVLDSGLRKTVFVDLGNGFFEPRTVETGWRFGDRVEIVQGLMPGRTDCRFGQLPHRLGKPHEIGRRRFLRNAAKRSRVRHGGLSQQGKNGRLDQQFEGKTYYFCTEECKSPIRKGACSSPGDDR